MENTHSRSKQIKAGIFNSRQSLSLLVRKKAGTENEYESNLNTELGNALLYKLYASNNSKGKEKT